jgi:glyoxylase-like metal-dependent hydrolase (beta-lactamase superfamily II)/rhodanese-related sulfurtransferase
LTEIIPIDTPTLGDRSYLAHDGHVAVVIDPQRDIDRVLALAGRHGVVITHVFETHLHNDYVTGGLALAAATGAAYHVNAADTVAFDRVAVRDGDVIEVSPSLRVRVLATPGHTFTHLSYVLEAGGQPPAVFTGGSLLYGSTGRPDLLGPGHTGALAHAQYNSAHRLATELPADAAVYPTHGFGSFCSATQSEGNSSTIGQERQLNPALALGEEEYVRELLAGLDAYPAYYAHMGPANKAGPGGADLSAPRRADAAGLRRRIEAGEWVADLRTRTAFAAGHVAGTLSFPLDGSFATYLGWLIPWGTPLTLLGHSAQEVASAQRELVRIGIDRPAAAVTGTPAEWAGGQPLRSYPVADFATLAAVRHHRPVVLLDVRRDLEWAQAHIDGGVHIPLHSLLGRLSGVPAGEVWVHCRSGYRASVAASLLDAAGRAVVAIDDEFDRAAGAGLPLVSGAAAGRAA